LFCDPCASRISAFQLILGRTIWKENLSKEQDMVKIVMTAASFGAAVLVHAAFFIGLAAGQPDWYGLRGGHADAGQDNTARQATACTVG
jgi:hypothetical protein